MVVVSTPHRVTPGAPPPARAAGWLPTPAGHGARQQQPTGTPASCPHWSKLGLAGGGVGEIECWSEWLPACSDGRRWARGRCQHGTPRAHLMGRVAPPAAHLGDRLHSLLCALVRVGRFCNACRPEYRCQVGAAWCAHPPRWPHAICDAGRHAQTTDTTTSHPAFCTLHCAFVHASSGR